MDITNHNPHLRNLTQPSPLGFRRRCILMQLLNLVSILVIALTTDQELISYRLPQ